MSGHVVVAADEIGHLSLFSTHVPVGSDSACEFSAVGIVLCWFYSHAAYLTSARSSTALAGSSRCNFRSFVGR